VVAAAEFVSRWGGEESVTAVSVTAAFASRFDAVAKQLIDVVGCGVTSEQDPCVTPFFVGL
jgi:hypothetical protein